MLRHVPRHSQRLETGRCRHKSVREQMLEICIFFSSHGIVPSTTPTRVGSRKICSPRCSIFFICESSFCGPKAFHSFSHGGESDAKVMLTEKLVSITTRDAE